MCEVILILCLINKSYLTIFLYFLHLIMSFFCCGWNYRYGELPPVLQLDHNEPPKPVVQCSQHMCPIQIHWHVKQSYTKYWRVKMTIRNLNYVKNYSQWNLVVLHPNLRSVTQVFSFNYKPLNQYGDTSKFYQCLRLTFPLYYDISINYASTNGVHKILHKQYRPIA